MSGVTTNTTSKLEHPVPRNKFGWGVSTETLAEKLAFEGRYFDRAFSANPQRFAAQAPKFMGSEMQAKWDKFQETMGRGPGSCDMSLLIKFVFGKRYDWFPQGIGSCVWSNTWRILVDRMLYEIVVKGDPEEYFGTLEHGPRTIAPHAIQYGIARQLANMRGPDGLYCKPMADSLAIGMMMCGTPKLKELMAAVGANSDYDYPEPRSNSLYRRIGDWAWNDQLRPYLDNKVTGSEPIKDFDTHLRKCKEYKPIFQCSGIAIKAAGKHKDGFTIHVQDQGNSWPHNMGHAGMMIASDGNGYCRFKNLSWYNDPNPEGLPLELLPPEMQERFSEDVLLAEPPAGSLGDRLDGPDWDEPQEKYIYNVPFEEVKRWYDRRLIDCQSVEEIDMPDSAPPSI